MVEYAQNDTSTVYAAGGDAYLKPIVMKSVNSQAWTHTFLQANNQNITTGWSGECGDGHWYGCVFQGWGDVAMQGTGGLYRTRDKGLTWTKISDEFRVNSVSIHPTQPNIAYYTTETNGLWYSSNAQATTPTFTQVANYTFRHPMRVFFNPYNLQEVWITSFGNGMKHGIDQTITVIPVELVSFSGKKINHVNVFNWETLSESNTLNFELQRLNKDNNFETIATLKAQNKAAKYSFTDDLTVEKTSATLINSIDYYRLKINDLDGKTTFSKTIGLENDKILRGIKSQFQVNFSNFNIN